MAACGGGGRPAAAVVPDSLPVFIGDSLPFEYPKGAYILRVQSDVTLRLYLDEYGRPVADSTRVLVPGTAPEFDSAAVQGARQLVFRPAYKDGKPIPFLVSFPIKFRVPGGPPLPSDSAPAASKD